MPPFALRLIPTYAAVVVLLLLARPTALGFAVGTVLVVIGAAIRIWSAGHLVKTERLATTGPYAYLRHPLYLGTLLIVLGFAIIAGGVASAVLLPALLLWFFVYYYPYKNRIESARLERLFGDDFAAYQAAVPALFPSRWPRAASPGSDAACRWSAELFHANHEAATLLGLCVGLCALALRPFLPI
ncbi:MAG: isoprenylcysteine carboxylmethyltransferase family protein [Deltaproteobacteria bacterium]|nr:MAG: isoprenylcysteine carboxylmethyltransferase family protein [Deltaproteobacteria bacterium]